MSNEDFLSTLKRLVQRESPWDTFDVHRDLGTFVAYKAEALIRLVEAAKEVALRDSRTSVERLRDALVALEEK